MIKLFFLRRSIPFILEVIVVWSDITITNLKSNYAKHILIILTSCLCNNIFVFSFIGFMFISELKEKLYMK